jgi:hypothetical protein
MRLAMILTAACLLTACGRGSGSSEASKLSSKGLFSRWTNTSDGSTVDLSGLTFGTFSIQLMPACGCMLDVSGSETNGDAAIYNCANSGPAIGSQCPATRTEYAYTNIGSQLSLCPKGQTTCAHYN